jgi:Peptidase family S41
MRCDGASRIRRVGVVAVVWAVVVGCGTQNPSLVPSGTTSTVSSAPSPAGSAAVSVAPGSPSPASSAAARDEGWRADIDELLAARERLHPDPWHGLDRATWVSAADAVKAKVPSLTDDGALVELVRLASMPGWGGREGHTGIFPFTPDSGTHEYPIRVWQFSDGMVITAARAPYEDLVGSRIEAIEGRPIADVLALVEPLAPRDNPSNLLAYAPLYMRVSELLAGLGVIDAAGPARFTIVNLDGKRRVVSIEPIPAAEDVAWHGGAPLELPKGQAMWLSEGRPLWLTYLADSKTLYVQYNSVERGIDPTADEILARAKEGDVDRVVVDLRRNGGGDNTTYRHWLGVLQDPAIDRPGRLTVLIGRLTFSAAANFATELEQTTGARFAGEAMGGSPNLYGDVRRADLPYGGVAVYIATRYWQKSTADDPRITIEPDLAVPYSSVDYRAGRDPVLDAVMR